MQRLKETYEDTLDTWSDFWDSVNERTADSWVRGIPLSLCCQQQGCSARLRAARSF